MGRLQFGGNYSTQFISIPGKDSQKVHSFKISSPVVRCAPKIGDRVIDIIRVQTDGERLFYTSDLVDQRYQSQHPVQLKADLFAVRGDGPPDYDLRDMIVSHAIMPSVPFGYDFDSLQYRIVEG